MADLGPFRDTTAPVLELQHLSTPAGVELLKTLGVRGTETEFEKLVNDVKGHALTLNLLGRYLAKAHGGDIRRRDQVKFEKADPKVQGGHASRVMAAYEKWLSGGGEDGARALAVLRLVGLFDRPADAGCLAVLREPPIIRGLTEPFLKEPEGFERLLKRPTSLTQEDWNLTLSSLADCGLISIQYDQSVICAWQAGIDAHPLVREYFAKQLRGMNPEAWRSAHRWLYEHLKTSAEYQPDNVEGLQPLYQAVAHGCQAGEQQAAHDEVYLARILRGLEFYSSQKLGAMGANLGAVASFFDAHWTRLSPKLTESTQASLLGEAAFYLRALGRLTEASEPTALCLANFVKCNSLAHAAGAAGSLSELELALGRVPEAIRHAEHAVALADDSKNGFQRMAVRAKFADVLHQVGRRAEALSLFREAEALQAQCQPDLPLLYSLGGFMYCDLLLSESERVAWFCCLRVETEDVLLHTVVQACHDVKERAAQVLKWDTLSGRLVDSAFHHHTLACAELCLALIENHQLGASNLVIEAARQHITTAVVGFRRAGGQEFIPRALLSRAWLRVLEGSADGALGDLDEAWQIAERGPMRLHLADIHLHRARLFFREKPYPWTSPQADLAAARQLIERCGYWRRKEELEDAEKVILP